VRDDKIFNQLRKLKQYKDTPDEELWAIARQRAREEVQAKGLVSKFKSASEKAQARSLLKRYLEDYSIETVSDRNTLKEVIYLEVVQTRLQDKLNEFHERDSKAIPIQLVEIIHKNSKIIIELKNALGLNKAKEKKSSYDAFDHLKKRFKKWREENQASRTLICPHCAKMVLLKIRTDIWEAQKHPFFKDKILYNKYLMELYRSNKISKEDVARVLECSPDYIDWLIDKIEKGYNHET
jgi:hypothetical protein